MKTKIFFFIAIMTVSISSLACANANGASSDLRLVNQNFYGIILNGNANVYLIQGDVNSVKVIGSKQHVDEVTTKIINGNLVINTGELRNVNIYVTMNETNLLQVNGSGKIQSMSPVNADMLLLKINGSGIIQADVRTLSLGMVINGNGIIYIGGMTGESFSKVKGDGKIIAANLDALHAHNLSFATYTTDTRPAHKSTNGFNN